MLTPAAGPAPRNLYQLYYEQKANKATTASLSEARLVLNFPNPSVSLTLDDAILGPVQQAWRKVMGDAANGEDVQYMVFADREGMDAEEDDEF